MILASKALTVVEVAQQHDYIGISHLVARLLWCCCSSRNLCHTDCVDKVPEGFEPSVRGVADGGDGDMHHGAGDCVWGEKRLPVLVQGGGHHRPRNSGWHMDLFPGHLHCGGRCHEGCTTMFASACSSFALHFLAGGCGCGCASSWSHSFSPCIICKLSFD